jgi:hypothetical protein
MQAMAADNIVGQIFLIGLDDCFGSDGHFILIKFLGA